MVHEAKPRTHNSIPQNGGHRAISTGAKSSYRRSANAADKHDKLGDSSRGHSRCRTNFSSAASPPAPLLVGSCHAVFLGMEARRYRIHGWRARGVGWREFPRDNVHRLKRATIDGSDSRQRLTARAYHIFVCPPQRGGGESQNLRWFSLTGNRLLRKIAIHPTLRRLAEYSDRAASRTLPGGSF